MTDDRIYTVGINGRFVGCESIQGDDDNEAIERAARLLRSFDIEIWRGSRMAKFLPAKARREEQED